MNQITDLHVAEQEVFQEIKQCISKVKSAVANAPADLSTGISVLKRLRQEIYEDLNQVQHEEMILQAARLLESQDFVGKDVVWHWNPRQGGGAGEPDLRGSVAGRIEVSAEITTSGKPDGTIAERMTTTLEKLSKMPGKKIYFVRTEAMEKRAETKVSKAGYEIEIRRV